jgi:hypothetical protein
LVKGAVPLPYGAVLDRTVELEAGTLTPLGVEARDAVEELLAGALAPSAEAAEAVGEAPIGL